MQPATVLAAVTASAATAVGATSAVAASYEVTITNMTHGVQFTPVLVVTHSDAIALFEPGAPASEELALLAEGGDTAPLEALLATRPDVVADFGNTGPDLLGPGQSVSVILKGGGEFDLVSLAGMLLPTNDSFVGADALRAPRAPGRSRTYVAFGYDAGSEPNDERCEHIPGPTCGGEGPSPDAGGEGFVHVSRGIAGVGDVAVADYDWRNPVARITVTRRD